MTAGREPSQRADEDPERRLRPASPPDPADEPGPDDADLDEDSAALEFPPDEELDAEEAESVGGRPPIEIYLSEIRRIPLLTREQEVELAKRVAAGDEAAKKRMVESNLRLVVMLARRYQNRGLPLGDLIAEGNLGLIRASRSSAGTAGPASRPTRRGGSGRPSSGPSPTRRGSSACRCTWRPSSESSGGPASGSPRSGASRPSWPRSPPSSG